MKKGWKEYLLYAVVVIAVSVLVYILVETVRAKNTGFETKTLWDWMDLLIIPAVLALGAFFLNRSERDLERKTAEDRAILERKIAEDRAKLERDLATERQQDIVLQTYFDRMSELLLKEQLRTTEKVEVRDVARTRTLSIMRVLDTKRNNLVIQFLREAKLITEEDSLFVNSNMQEMDLRYLNLMRVNFNRANLQVVDFMGSNLLGANLSSASLLKANLQDTDLWSTSLRGAFLNEANLKGISVNNLDLQGAYLTDANLKNARLGGANLVGASLPGANLKGASLAGANLEGANLTNTNLEGVDLRSARNITKEQLASVKSLKGAIMPDGTKHE